MFLHALGHYHPPTLITNAFLASLEIGTDDAWIVDRVGIHTRHSVLPLDYIRSTKNKNPQAALEAALMSNAETGAAAARMALDRAGLKPSDIGLVISGNCSTDECIPAEACRVAEELGIEAPALDIASACSSFGAQVFFLEGMRPERLPDWVLVVNPDNSTRVVDYSDRSSCVLWGDASTAAIFSPRNKGPWRVTETYLRGSPAGADKVKTPRFGFFAQQGAAVQSFAVKRSVEVFEELEHRWLAADSTRQKGQLTFIGHQANLRMLESVAKRCAIPADRHPYNVDRRGNCGAAGAPSVMSELWGDPKLGEAVAICVVGSGLTWAGSLLERVG